MTFRRETRCRATYLCSGEHATRSMTAATRWRSASESPTSKSLSPLPVSCAITSTYPADTPASPRRRRATCCSPEHLPGRPITPAPLGQRLAQLGIDAQTGSRAAMLPPLEGFPVRPARGAPRGPHRAGDSELAVHAGEVDLDGPGVTNSVCAMVRFVWPSAASRATRSSLGVNAAGPFSARRRGRAPLARNSSRPRSTSGPAPQMSASAIPSRK